MFENRDFYRFIKLLLQRDRNDIFLFLRETPNFGNTVPILVFIIIISVINIKKIEFTKKKNYRVNKYSINVDNFPIIYITTPRFSLNFNIFVFTNSTRDPLVVVVFFF